MHRIRDDRLRFDYDIYANSVHTHRKRTHRLMCPHWIRRRPTLPGGCPPSTISVLRLNFCVRYGNRWIPQAIVTGNFIQMCLHTLKTAQISVPDVLLSFSLPSPALLLTLHSRFSTASFIDSSSIVSQIKPSTD